MKDFAANLICLCERKPKTTYDNDLRDWGVKFVEGYSVKGKRGMDLLLSSTLDEIEPQ